MTRRWGATVLAGWAALLLAGCGGAGEVTSVAERVYDGLPEVIEYQQGKETLQAVWLSDATRFAVVTWGSSSCPLVASELTVHAPDRAHLTFVQPATGLCTADLAATTHEFVTPEALDARPVRLTISQQDGKYTEQLTLE